MRLCHRDCRLNNACPHSKPCYVFCVGLIAEPQCMVQLQAVPAFWWILLMNLPATILSVQVPELSHKNVVGSEASNSRLVHLKIVERFIANNCRLGALCSNGTKSAQSVAGIQLNYETITTVGQPTTLWQYVIHQQPHSQPLVSPETQVSLDISAASRTEEE